MPIDSILYVIQQTHALPLRAPEILRQTLHKTHMDVTATVPNLHDVSLMY